MAECGDKYRGLIRTASGLTADDPCKFYCTEVDYAEWHEAAVQMISKVAVHWGELRKIEIGKFEGASKDAPTPVSDAMRKELGAYSEATKDLPTPWLTMVTHLPSQKVNQAVAVMEQGACALENMDAAFERVGVEAPKLYGPTGPQEPESVAGGFFEKLETLAMIAVVGGVAYGIGSFYLKRRAIIKAEGSL